MATQPVIPQKPKMATVQNGGGFGTQPAPTNVPGSAPAPSPMPSIPSLPSTPPLNVTASTYPELEALQDRYTKYLDNLEGNTGHIMDIAGQKLRDAREGGKASLAQSQGLRGVASSPGNARYEADTQRGVQSAITDVATERERTLGAALGTGVGVLGAPADLALREKGFGLDAYQAQQAASANQFQMWMALLNAQRSSPLESIGSQSPGRGGVNVVSASGPMSNQPATPLPPRPARPAHTRVTR